MSNRWVAASLSASAFMATVSVAIGWGMTHPAPVYEIPPNFNQYDPGLYTPFTHTPTTGRPARPNHPRWVYTPPAVPASGR